MKIISFFFFFFEILTIDASLDPYATIHILNHLHTKPVFREFAAWIYPAMHLGSKDGIAVIRQRSDRRETKENDTSIHINHIEFAWIEDMWHEGTVAHG